MIHYPFATQTPVRKAQLGLALAVLLGAGITGGVLATTGGADPSQATVSAPSAISDSQTATQDAEQMSNVYSNVTKSAAKEMTFANIQSAANAGATVNSPEASSSKVWVVAISGTVHPQFDVTGQTFSWGVEVFDASTGQSVAEFAGPSGGWPSYFDALPDLSASSTSSS